MNRNWKNYAIQHPILDGVACGVAFFVLSTILISVAFPALAVSIPITEHIVINLGDLPPWIGAIVALVVYLEARKARKNAAEAAALAALGRTEIKAVAVQIDGMLADRDKAKVKEGQQAEKIAGEETAKTLAEGQRQGAENERASAAVRSGPSAADGKQPLPVTDERATAVAESTAEAVKATAEAAKLTAEATKSTAEATGRLADATGKIADAGNPATDRKK